MISQNFSLRPYQADCIDAVADQFTRHDSTLVVKPTGTGKTVTFSHIVRKWRQQHDSRVLVIAHRDELIRQSASKLNDIVGIEPAIEMGDERSDEGFFKSPVIVSSVQTMSRPNRLERFDPHGFGLVIIDEAHHATAETYRRVIDHFSQGGVKLLGVTATPDRTDEEALGQIFQSVAFDYQLPQAIRDGWLVPIEQRFIFVEGLDLSGVKTTAGDLNAGELSKVLQAEESLHGVVYPTIELAGDEPTLVFAASVSHAEQMAEIFNRHKDHSALCIHGETPMLERREALTRYRNGEFQYLCNCGVFLEGFDEPRISVVAMARPTKSRSLYAQAVGRGTRPLTGCIDGLDTAEERSRAINLSAKPSVLVLDFVGNSGRHKLVSTADILGGNVSDEIVDRAKASAAKKSAAGESVDMLDEIEEAKRTIEEESLRRRAAIKPAVRFGSQNIDPFDLFDIVPRREPGWFKGKKPTERQRATLLKFGVRESQVDSLSFSKASQLLDTLIQRIDKNKCSLKQATLLRKHGYSQDMSFQDASATIDRLAKNGWKRPAGDSDYGVNAELASSSLKVGGGRSDSGDASVDEWRESAPW